MVWSANSPEKERKKGSEGASAQATPLMETVAVVGGTAMEKMVFHWLCA